MPPLPRLTVRELLAKLERLGFVRDRQTGSHFIIRHKEDPGRFAVVAVHSRRVIPPGTLKHILATARVSAEMLDDA